MKDLIRAVNRLSVALFPKRCEFCGEVIEFDRSICSECEDLPKIKAPLCDSCGCSKDDCVCKKNKNEYKRIIAPYYYRDTVVTAIHRYKESEMDFLSSRFSRDMAVCIRENYGDISFDAVTFVPMRAWDKIKRGYNQSEILAKEISRTIDVPPVDILVKTVRTKPQKKRSASERKVNVFGVFDVKDKAYVQDKTFLLIDDVKTTGSTLNECAKMLKIYGAKAVYCAALAIVNNKNDAKNATD